MLVPASQETMLVPDAYKAVVTFHANQAGFGGLNQTNILPMNIGVSKVMFRIFSLTSDEW